LGFACAVPFAAFGAVSAMTLPRRDALLLAVALWLINQVIGFAVLHYPWDGMTLAWGAILGATALLSTAAAQAAMRGQGVVVTAATSFAAAFLVYEGGLYLISALCHGRNRGFLCGYRRAHPRDQCCRICRASRGRFTRGTGPSCWGAGSSADPEPVTLTDLQHQVTLELSRRSTSVASGGKSRIKEAG
jgi:hypothetical protein